MRSRIDSSVVFGSLVLSLFPSAGLCWTGTHSPLSRRELLQNVAVASGCTSMLTGRPAWAGEETTIPKKPFAPIEQLLPAARVKWTIDRAVQLADSSNPNWSRLQELLLIPQNYTNAVLPKVPTAPAKAYLDTYQRNRESLNVLEKPGALLVQSGEIAAWKRLKRQERRAEEGDEIRAALNLYTTSLNYNAESYLLNVPAAQRKQMIRDEKLPDVKQVIQSDMGLRYLIRNELLSTMGEVQAELEYQLKQEEPASEELVALLRKAQDACNQWFALIDERDVQEALGVVQKEKGG